LVAEEESGVPKREVLCAAMTHVSGLNLICAFYANRRIDGVPENRCADLHPR